MHVPVTVIMAVIDIPVIKAIKDVIVIRKSLTSKSSRPGIPQTSVITVIKRTIFRTPWTYRHQGHHVRLRNQRDYSIKPNIDRTEIRIVEISRPLCGFQGHDNHQRLCIRHGHQRYEAQTLRASQLSRPSRVTDITDITVFRSSRTSLSSRTP
jgi:hypothetical protein